MSDRKGNTDDAVVGILATAVAVSWWSLLSARTRRVLLHTLVLILSGAYFALRRVWSPPFYADVAASLVTTVVVLSLARTVAQTAVAHGAPDRVVPELVQRAILQIVVLTACGIYFWYRAAWSMSLYADLGVYVVSGVVAVALARTILQLFRR